MMAKMRQLLNEYQNEMKRTIETTITHHVQPLNTAITQERLERVQAIDGIQVKFLNYA